MAVGDAYVFPGFLTPVLTQLFFPKPPTTFLTCFCRGERRKYAGKKSRLNRRSNSQPPGHESNTLTAEPPGRGDNFRALAGKLSFLPTKLDIFNIRQHCVCILFIFQRFVEFYYVCLFVSTNMNLAVYGNGLGVVMTSWMTLTVS